MYEGLEKLKNLKDGEKIQGSIAVVRYKIDDDIIALEDKLCDRAFSYTLYKMEGAGLALDTQNDMNYIEGTIQHTIRKLCSIINNKEDSKLFKIVSDNIMSRNIFKMAKVEKAMEQLVNGILFEYNMPYLFAKDEELEGFGLPPRERQDEMTGVLADICTCTIMWAGENIDSIKEDLNTLHTKYEALKVTE